MIQDEYIVVFGEVLYDCFADDIQVLGGAPFNVAWNLKGLGAHPLFISKVGNDELGASIIQAMNDWGMSTDGVQVDDNYDTGKVEVSFYDNEPSYDIVDNAAYDFIDASNIPYLPLNGIIYHGSLALRHAHNQQALYHLKTQMNARFFVDVNLRAPWWEKAKIEQISQQADWIKLNNDELDLLTREGNENSRIAQFFSSAENIKELILTKGEAGAVSITPEGEFNTVYPIPGNKFVDTVGAGDAFSSVMLLGKYLSWPNDLTMRRAQDFASAVVGLRGATTQDKDFYNGFVEKWQINTSE
ncbi:MAG: carbohydrate kinase [Gammaproteobacteria bacterium]|nr:carbohydrate kinase [Gammaproteobacteria bacterium]